MDRQTLIIGLVGVLLVGAFGILLTRSEIGNRKGSTSSQEVSGDVQLEREENDPNLDISVSESGIGKESENESNTGTTVKYYTQPPAMQIDPAKQYSAVFRTTEGVVVIALYAERTPVTVNNFVTLVKDDFYDGTIFHRVIEGFMIQGGDPEGTGAGGPGYTFDDEPFEGKYKRGIVAMANAGPNTNGSQFFIMHKDYDLPPSYVIFGEVTEGMEVVDKIAAAATEPGGESSTPVSPVKVETVTIEEK